MDGWMDGRTEVVEDDDDDDGLGGDGSRRGRRASTSLCRRGEGEKAMCDGSDSRVSNVSIGLRQEKSLCSGFSLLRELYSELCHLDKPHSYQHDIKYEEKFGILDN